MPLLEIVSCLDGESDNGAKNSAGHDSKARGPTLFLVVINDKNFIFTLTAPINL